MATMSVSLPDKMRQQVRAMVECGDFHNESEYIRDLIRRDQERKAKERRLLEHLEAAEASGVSERSVLDIMRDVQERLDRERLNKDGIIPAQPHGRSKD